VAALQALKGVLGGLVWAEEPLGTPSVDFPRFYGELVGAVQAASYRAPVQPGREGILVANVVQARGVPFRSVAVMGLAEGEFPATLSEDAFLRDADRARLRERFGLPLQPSTESAEAEFFYETITRPRERLLLTRPRLADNGAPWQASPFWEEVRRLIASTPQTLTSESLPTPAQTASWPELMESLAATPYGSDVRGWVLQAQPVRQSALETATRLFRLRAAGAAGSLHNGDLSALAGEFSHRFGPGHTWSSSRLESYRTCPYFFFVDRILGLEPREEPAEGLDARQLGTIYHRILQRLYSAVSDPADLKELLQALPRVAQSVLDGAPRREGFRATAWWEQTCSAILEDVRRSLVALAEDQGHFAPHLYEAFFGFMSRPPLIIYDGDDSFRLRGLIDRVDRSPDGRVRIIDYKTAGPWAFTDRALLDGRRIQLPLYALAARDALRLGEVIDGFYWHVRHAQASRFTMDGFEGGPEGAMALAAAYAWEAVRSARDGRFEPRPPAEGCPPYCPAASFCWQYRSGFGG
jgi:ATP-dependent helicase/DNAse subunit B